MTTKHSSLRRLKAQADLIATILKKAERGETIHEMTFSEKVIAARDMPTVKFAIGMDDKIVTIEIAWSTIAETEEAALSEWIVRQMREEKGAAN